MTTSGHTGVGVVGLAEVCVFRGCDHVRDQAKAKGLNELARAPMPTRSPDVEADRMAGQPPVHLLRERQPGHSEDGSYVVGGSGRKQRDRRVTTAHQRGDFRDRTVAACHGHQVGGLGERRSEIFVLGGSIPNSMSGRTNECEQLGRARLTAISRIGIVDQGNLHADAPRHYRSGAHNRSPCEKPSLIDSASHTTRYKNGCPGEPCSHTPNERICSVRWGGKSLGSIPSRILLDEDREYRAASLWDVAIGDSLNPLSDNRRLPPIAEAVIELFASWAKEALIRKQEHQPPSSHP